MMKANSGHRTKIRAILKLVAIFISFGLLAGCGSSSKPSTPNSGGATLATLKVEVNVSDNPPLPNATPVIVRIQGDDSSNKDVDIFKVIPLDYADIRKQFDKADNTAKVNRKPSVRITPKPLVLEELAQKPGNYFYKVFGSVSPDGAIGATSDTGNFNNTDPTVPPVINMDISAIPGIENDGLSDKGSIKFLEDAVKNTNKASDTAQIKEIKALIEKRMQTRTELAKQLKKLEKSGNHVAYGVIRIIDSPKTAARWLWLPDDEAEAYMETLHKIDPNAKQFPHVEFDANHTFQGSDTATGETVKLNKNFAKGVVLLPTTLATKYADQAVALVIPWDNEHAKWYADKRLQKKIPVLDHYKLYVINETVQEVQSP